MTRNRLMLIDIDDASRSDGDVIENLDLLGRLIGHRLEDAVLVYSTGRSFRSAWKLVSSGVLPEPAAIVACRGTEIWFPEWVRPDPFYQELVRHRWNRDTVVFVAKRIPGLTLVEEAPEAPFKVSFEIDNTTNVFDLKRALDNSGIDVLVIYSAGRYADVVPRGGGRWNAVEFLRRVYDVAPDALLTYGVPFNPTHTAADAVTVLQRDGWQVVPSAVLPIDCRRGLAEEEKAQWIR